MEKTREKGRENIEKMGESNNWDKQEQRKEKKIGKEK